MVTTTDPYNLIIQTVRAHLRSNLTDPLGTSRDTNKPFVSAGKSLLGVQYPYIHVTLGTFGPTSDAALGTEINATEQAKTILVDVMIEVITQEEDTTNSLANEKLLNNLSSAILIQMTQLAGKQTLDGDGDFKQVELGSSDAIIGPVKGQIKKVHIYDVEFLWRY